MKASKNFLLAFIVFALAVIACGSNSNISVTVPEETEEIVEDIRTDETLDNQEVATEEVIVEETEIVETKEVGTARSNPAPVGSSVSADDMTFSVSGAIRPATDIVMDANMFNTEPEEGEEYILVELQVTCDKSVDESCSFSPYLTVGLIGNSGIKYESELFVAGLDGDFEGVEFYGGATVTGYIPFIISQDETELILVYEPLLFGDDFYLALPSE